MIFPHSTRIRIPSFSLFPLGSFPLLLDGASKSVITDLIPSLERDVAKLMVGSSLKIAPYTEELKLAGLGFERSQHVALNSPGILFVYIMSCLFLFALSASFALALV